MSWRDTLFVWEGKACFVKASRDVFEWKGSWVGVDSSTTENFALPPGQSFAESKMLFSIGGKKKGSVHLEDFCSTVNSPPSAQEAMPVARLESISLQAAGGKGWLLDDMKYHKDHAHDLLFYELEGVFVGATGANDFGSFLAMGRCDGVSSIAEIESGKEFTLTLGRRYVSVALRAIIRTPRPWSNHARHEHSWKKMTRAPSGD